MEKAYQVPSEEAGHLSVGNWVEIFEAYGEAEGEKAIRVRSMRVGGRILVFANGSPRRGGSRALRPHEGEVVFIERGPEATRFRLRMRS